MTYATARTMDADDIPVVDITELGNGLNARKVAAALHAASQNLGFIYIKGHGIPPSIIESARDSAYQFFRASETQKSSVRISRCHRGYLAQGGARMQDDSKTDLKESFIWGGQHEDEPVPGDHPLRGANQWPAFLPTLKDHARSYFDHAHEVARQLMRGFALGLDLPDNFFLQTCVRPLSRASFVYYPAQPYTCGDEQFGVAPHTDFGVLTVLCQDHVGGLQVQHANGDWIHAPPVADTLVVNVGDLLRRWTDGAYKSTPHRVVNSSGAERLSLVLAFDPDPDTMIDSRDIYGPHHIPREPPVSCGDYLTWRFEKAFSYRKKDTMLTPASTTEESKG